MEGSEDAAAYKNEDSASEDSTDGDSEEDIYDDEVTKNSKTLYLDILIMKNQTFTYFNKALWIIYFKIITVYALDNLEPVNFVNLFNVD